MQDNTLPKKPSNALIWIGGILIFFAVLIIIFAGYDLVSDSHEEGATEALIAGFAPLGLAIFLIWMQRNDLYHYKIQLHDYYEPKIFEYAMNESNRITLAEIVVSLNVSTDRAKTVLDKMVSKGIADLLVSEEGFPVYQIQGIGINKDTAKSAMN